MIDALITTASRQQGMLEKEAMRISEDWDIPYVRRGKASIKSFFAKYGVTNIAVLDYQMNVILYREDQEPIKYHPGMSTIRIKRLQVGNNDPMVELLQLGKNDTLLDCTLGMASDAIVAQYIASGGQVTGLETNRLLALFTARGLKTYIADDLTVQEAMNRIKVVHADYNRFLAEAADNAYDYVYFDPMFRSTVESSSSMQFFKSHCCDQPVSIEAVREAKRVAKKMVVLKERTYSREFKRLGFEAMIRPNSSFSYGIIRLEEA